MFVVVLTDDGQQLTRPRVVGPFGDYDGAQVCANALIQQWEIEHGEAPQAVVARVEEPLVGVVVGEL